MSQANDSASNHLAVIGLSGCFPGAADVGQFWENLSQGRESVEFLSAEEIARHGIDPAVIAEPNYVRAVARVEGAEFFDNSFFGFTPREAEVMDPQLRRLLQHSWAALENAGYNPESYKGSSRGVCRHRPEFLLSWRTCIRTRN
jgi:acyl transferase domain-containing protein